MLPNKHIATSVNRDFHFYNRPKNPDSFLNMVCAIFMYITKVVQYRNRTYI